MGPAGLPLAEQPPDGKGRLAKGPYPPPRTPCAGGVSRVACGGPPMTRRLKAPQRRARRVARRNRDAEPRFDLLAVAARSADRSELPLRRWPGNDLAFIDAILEAHNVPIPLAKRLGAAAARLSLGSLLAERLSAALAD